jgi:GWxTD domain-containing protein
MRWVVEPKRCRITSTVVALCTLLPVALGQSGNPPRNRATEHGLLRLDGGPPFYKTWLEEDVVWIITDEERAIFKLLKNEEERDRFIEAFWSRRDRTPDTYENEYKEEHYRRIAYANDHFATQIPGWKTDRGRYYIMYGLPDKIESYPSGLSPDETPNDEESSADPVEVWRYRYIEGIGKDVVLEFVDVCKCDEYHMIMTLAMEKYTLRYVPIGPWGRSKSKPEPVDPLPFLRNANHPSFRFKDLESSLHSQRSSTSLPFEVHTSTGKATRGTALVAVGIAVPNRNISVVEKGDAMRGKLNIFGRVTTLTGRTAEVFEDSVDINFVIGAAATEKAETTFYSKSLALRYGRYRVEIAVQDVNGNRIGTWMRGVRVLED